MIQKFIRLLVAATVVALGLPGQAPLPTNGAEREAPGRLPRGVNAPGLSGAPPRGGSVFLSGRVMLDDGSAPSVAVVIERVCNGRSKPEGYTDRRGRFSFELGRSTLTTDASDGMSNDGAFGTAHNVHASERDLVGCSLRAALAGYVSEAVSLSGHRALDNPEVGIILLHRRASVEGLTTSVTSLKAPKGARQAYQKALKLQRGNKPEEAMGQLERAVAAYASYAAAWYDLGVLYERANRLEEAREAYRRSLEADPKYIRPQLQMAGLHALAGEWKLTAEAAQRVIQLNPYDFPAAYFYRAVAAVNLHDLPTAERAAREGLKLDTDDRIPKLSHVLGLVLAQKHEPLEAAASLKRYLKLAPRAADAELVRQQVAEIEREIPPQAAPQQAAPPLRFQFTGGE